MNTEALAQLAPTVRVDGQTRLVPLLAYPSEHVRTPAIFNRYCVEHGINALMVAWKVAPEHLAAAIAAMRHVENIAGAVITIPHKHDMAEQCDELEGTARHIRVCNVVRRSASGNLVGAVLDGLGFVQGLKDHGIEPAGRSALLAGAGGAATAVAFELLANGVTRLAIANRSRDKAEALVQLLRQSFPAAQCEINPQDLAGYDLAVNATSLGMKANDPLPFDPGVLPSEAIVAEVVMQPDITALLRQSAQRGLRTHKGIHMVEAQVKLLVEFTTGGA